METKSAVKTTNIFMNLHIYIIAQEIITTFTIPFEKQEIKAQ